MRAGHGLILVVLCLLLLGVVMVTSAGLGVDAAARLSLAGVLTSRPACFAALAAVLGLVATRLPVRAPGPALTLRSPILWLVGGIIVLLLAVHVPGIGHEVNGARRWIRLGPIGFQPSELAKWGLPVVLAWHAAHRAPVMGSLWRGFVAPMTLVGVVCALIATEDLGTAVLIGLVSVGMLLAAGARLAHVGMLVPAGACGIAAAVVASPYRVDRLRAFLDPYQDPQGIGFHVIQSMGAVAGGGLPGRGLGNGVQKFGYLPEDTTDFIFAIIAEELGVLGPALIVCLYAALLLCGLAVVTRTAHPFGRVLGLGILLTVGLQALINLLVVTGLAPTKGIALPLVSAGGTGWCLTAFSLGLLVALDRDAARAEAPATPPDVAAPVLAA